MDSSNELASEHKKFQQTPNEELIVENLPNEIPANELEIQLKEREPMLLANTSKLKVYSRKGKSTTSSHIPSSNLESGNENIHSSVYNDLYWLIALRKGTRKCTQNPISNFTSLHRLSSTYRVFITQMSSVEIPNAIQEALRDENWRKTINEEMQALEKNETWDMV